MRHLRFSLILFAAVFASYSDNAVAGISAGPTPNTGSYSVSWTAIYSADDGYKLYERIKQHCFCNFGYPLIASSSKTT